MPLIKDTSYRDIPYSSETPEEDFHSYLTVRQVVTKASKHQNHTYRVRSVGIVASKNSQLYFYELDDSAIQIQLVVADIQVKPTPLPHERIVLTCPCTAQIFGRVEYKHDRGPTLYAEVIHVLWPSVAVHLRNTMSWVVHRHYAQPGVNTSQKREEDE